MSDFDLVETEALSLAERLNQEEEIPSEEVVAGFENALDRLDRLGWSE